MWGEGGFWEGEALWIFAEEGVFVLGKGGIRGFGICARRWNMGKEESVLEGYTSQTSAVS